MIQPMKKIADIPAGGFGRLEKWENNQGEFFARKFFEPHVPGLTPDETEKFKKRFLREIKVQSQLAGDHVVPILAYDLSSNPPSYDMPFCQQSLDDLIRTTPHDQDKISAALADVLNGLEYLHSLGYTHRDLKPQNILFHDGKWKLADFGLVLPPAGSATTKLTSVGSAWGTQPYAAPEQAHAFGSVTFKTDIYAFGCILHDIFGRPPRIPFQRQTAPGEVGIIIEKCTEVDPARRFKSIGHLRGALLTCLASATFRAPSATGAEWLNALATVSAWTPEKCTELCHFLATAPADDRNAFFNILDEDHLTAIAAKDLVTWDVLARDFCRWTDKPHVFAFCDVLVRRLERVFEIGGLEIKALAAIGIAKLGASHNRWFVMGRLVAHCGPNLQNEVAARLAIEIFVEDAQDDFVQSAEGISLDKTAYHVRIAAVLP